MVLVLTDGRASVTDKALRLPLSAAATGGLAGLARLLLGPGREASLAGLGRPPGTEATVRIPLARRRAVARAGPAGAGPVEASAKGARLLGR